MREPYERRRLAAARGRRRAPGQHAGELTEATRANLALSLGGPVVDTPLASGCLPGVERARLLDLGRLHERVLRPDLAAAEGLAVVSSLRGWRSARLLAVRRARRRRAATTSARSTRL